MQEPGLFDTPSVGELYAKEDARYMANTVGGRGSIEAGIGNLFNMGMQGLNRATGNEDEEIQKARKIQEVKKYVSENVQGGDMVTYYKGLAEAFKKFGMFDEAYRVERVIAGLEDKDLDRDLKKSKIATEEATAAAKLAEKQPEFVKLQRAYREAVARGDTEAAEQIKSKLKEMASSALTSIKTGAGGEQVSEVLIDRNGDIVFKGDPYKQKPMVEMGAEKEGTKVIAQRNADSIKQVQGDMRLYQEMAPAMTQIEQIMSGGGVNTGITADMKTVMQRALSAAGLLSEKDAQTLTNTQILQKYTTDLVLPKMQALGGQDSNQELTTLMKSVINSSFEPETIKRMLAAYRKHSKRVGTKYKKVGNLSAEDIGSKLLNLEDYSEEDAQLNAEEAAPKQAPKPKVEFERGGPIKDSRGVINLDEYARRLNSAKPSIPPDEQARRMAAARAANAKITGKQ